MRSEDEIRDKTDELKADLERLKANRKNVSIFAKETLEDVINIRGYQIEMLNWVLGEQEGEDG